MSIRSLSSLALQRDAAAPKRTKRRPTSAEDAKKTEQQRRADVLVAMIPTEPLAVYTAAVALVVAQIGNLEPENQYMLLRWILFAGFCAGIPGFLIVTYLRNKSATKSRRLPFAEVVSAALAFGAWGLIMPGSPLAAELDGGAEQLTIGLITLLSAFALATLFGSTLEKQAKTTEAKAT